MIKLLMKYIIAVLTVSCFIVLLLDNVLLPLYVGYGEEIYVPDVRGMYQPEAEEIMIKNGLKVKTIVLAFSSNNIPGQVIKTFPSPFTKVKLRRSVVLTVGGPKEDVYVPNVIDKSFRNAKIILREVGINIDTLIYEFSSDYDKNRVTFQVPTKGHIVKSGSMITLGISKGMPPDYFIIPDLINLSLGKAKEKISLSGLRLGNIIYEHEPDLLAGTVIEQSMVSGLRVSFPAKIDLILSKDNNEE